MICPACGGEQPDPPGRFCAACAIALPYARRPEPPKQPPAEHRCPECGVVVTSSRCRGCGARVKLPEE